MTFGNSSAATQLEKKKDSKGHSRGLAAMRAFRSSRRDVSVEIYALVIRVWIGWWFPRFAPYCPK